MYYTLKTSYTFGQSKQEIIKHESKQKRVEYIRQNPDHRKIGFVDAIKLLNKQGGYNV